jgi:hypothetical protein
MGYIRFDLTGQDVHATPNASLQFVVASVWDATTPWQVYGLKNADAGESWVESSITWNNAPANTSTSGDALVSSRVVLLGTLATTGTQPLGKVLELQSAALDDFLLADTNNRVSFILTRANTATPSSCFGATTVGISASTISGASTTPCISPFACRSS